MLHKASCPNPCPGVTVLARWGSAAWHGTRAGDPRHIPLHGSCDLGHHLSSIPLLIPLGS